jgi:hypothetical protein
MKNGLRGFIVAQSARTVASRLNNAIKVEITLAQQQKFYVPSQFACFACLAIKFANNNF